MMKNLYLYLQGRNYPGTPVDTVGPIFVQQQLVASLLHGFELEATDEYKQSLIVPRSSSTRRLRPHTDLTSFIFITPLERTSVGDLSFDGTDSGGQNIAVSIRGTPIFQGAMDTYYDVRGDGTARPPPPTMAMKQRCSWIFTARGNGTCTFETNRPLPEAVRREMGTM